MLVLGGVFLIFFALFGLATAPAYDRPPTRADMWFRRVTRDKFPSMAEYKRIHIIISASSMVVGIVLLVVGIVQLIVAAL